ncbi:nitroreductase family protein [Sulfurirhabdus autotrophica]|uniref:Nitroreductase n=1 Tax=Sulfurirhabdus autotrophica TaxID=1706046 RepID=A0A4R3XRQ9_9PROT|nr:nitroreductase family protein [Sulfurirhabdus autotrophica]TCV80230.1 nitroreductase [Sulfurirhabdus autotrophica]
MTSKIAKTQVPVHDIIARRWSPRAFDASKPVTREQLISILEAARWAPSCFGDEPWRYLVWDKNSNLAAWQRAFDCLGEFNQQWVKNAPILMLATASSTFRHNGKPNAWHMYDTGASSENICLQATSLGLFAHQMGGFDADKIRQEFDIPKEFACLAMIAVGYQTTPDVLPKDLEAKEIEERARRPLEECFFENSWDAGIK